MRKLGGVYSLFPPSFLKICKARLELLFVWTPHNVVRRASSTNLQVNQIDGRLHNIFDFSFVRAAISSAYGLTTNTNSTLSCPAKPSRQDHQKRRAECQQLVPNYPLHDQDHANRARSYTTLTSSAYKQFSDSNLQRCNLDLDARCRTCLGKTLYQERHKKSEHLYSLSVLIVSKNRNLNPPSLCNHKLL